MGKPKNKSKGREVDLDDDDIDKITKQEEEEKPVKAQSKKDKKKKKKKEDSDDDADTITKQEEEEEEKPVKAQSKKDKKKKKKKEDSEDDSELDSAVKHKEEEEEKPVRAQSKKEKKKKKKNDDWEDDIAAEIGNMALEANKDNLGQDTIEDPVVMKKKKEKKKKGKHRNEEDEEEDEEGVGNQVQLPKPKPGTKKAAHSFQMLMMDDENDDDVNEDEERKSESDEEKPVEVEPSKKQQKKKEKKKKGKEKKQEDEDIGALLAEIENPSEKSGKKSKKDRKKGNEVETMEVEETENKGEPQTAVVKVETKVVTMEDLEMEEEENRKKRKKKKGKEKKQEDEDIDALLAEIDKPGEKSGTKLKKGNEVESMEVEKAENKGEPLSAVVKVETKVVTMEDLEMEEEEDRKKRKNKKGKKDDANQEEAKEGETMEDEEEGESTVKTAAQKRKEKKEREKQKKLEEKKKQKVKPTKEGKEKEESEKPEEAPAQSTTAIEETKEEKASGDEEEKDEGKKKKKKKGEKEEKKKKSKAPLAAIKEHLKKIQEEEERLRKEEEERIQREEEELKKFEEKRRLEEERKQKKKEKEKLRKERLRQEGKLLTDKQKQDRRRALQLLETMKQQGVEVPSKDETDARKDDVEVKKKRIIYVDKKKKKHQLQQQQQADSEENKEEERTPSPMEEEPKEEVPAETVIEKIEEVKMEHEEGKQEEESEEFEELKDAWDISSEEEEEEEEEEQVVPKAAKITTSKEKQEESEEEEEEEDEDEEEEEEEDEDEEESEEEEESESEDERSPIERARENIMKRKEEAEKNRTTDVLRAPVVCVLGHVDTGKTKILDKLRRTHVQEGEAGGITQQIGATNVPHEALKEKTSMCKEFQKTELKLPGLLIIDTPGHESFSNLRLRGSSLCDIAVLVVDIMHGLEPQTIESINLLKEKKTPFVVALNKIDRLYGWKTNPASDVVNTIKKQALHTRQEFDERVRETLVQLAEQGLNSCLFYENKNPREYISLVPTSAHSGDGMGNLVALICELTQTMMAKRLSYSEDLFATVMEVKSLPGLGTTIDVILVNGKLREGDTVVVGGTEGPIVSQIRGLLMPQPMKELRVKSQYEHHKEVKAAQGVKLIGKDFEHALAGLPLYVAHDQDEIAYYKEEISSALREVLNSIKLSERGVFVQASTLGSLEALLEFLRTSKIPYAGINIGPIHKKDIMKASIMLEHESQYAVILAFDVKVERDAQELADSLGVKIFVADIIYHLFDKFTAYREELKKQKQEEFKHIAVFPCKLRILPQFIFNSRDPIVVGVSVEAGFVKEGTPICVPSKEFLELGRVVSVEINHKSVESAHKGQEVCIKIENIPGDTPKLYGRHFDHTDLLVSKITRQSIDAVKEYFRDEMQKQDWQLMVELKKQFEIL
ncbi:hypothetical protein ACJMK2_032447 [Sinanodonta woodiana]|uniref:Eukaryotic translation initiation factor 5B n=1 Tax=Sinanodonta woodiana TaxID=1069815 RepID=A0ABD3X1S2_SINWO